jgi:hypothetical protein
MLRWQSIHPGKIYRRASNGNGGKASIGVEQVTSSDKASVKEGANMFLAEKAFAKEGTKLTTTTKHPPWNPTVSKHPTEEEQ